MNETKDTLKPTLSEKVNGIIWKILIDEEKHLLAIESRDADNKQVYFSVFNFRNGLTHFKNITLHERWNLSMAYLSEGHLLIKVFPEEGNPASKGIIAIDCATGNVAWEKYNIAYQYVWQEGLEVYNPDLLPRRTFLVDIKTGCEIQSATRSAETSSILLPEQQDLDSIPGWLKHDEIVGQVLYIQANGKNCLAFHEKTATEIRLRLIVYQDVAIFVDIILKQNIQKLLPEAFFIAQNHLFCVRGNNEVISYLV